ncbi:MAG TPA: ABC transporter permease [Solirubrobacteraceae bacterium]|jgi:sulfonate transport system permease protein|nr:ABC transporter permease [Solirubrobacteraceae bacterium]
MDELALNEPSVLPSVAAGVDHSGSHLVVPRLLVPKPPSKYTRWGQRILGPVGVFVLWWVVTAGFHLVGEQVLPSPSEVWQGYEHLVATHQLWASISISIRRALFGLLFGIVAGVGIGLFTGITGIGDRIIDPVVQMFRTVPVLALSPLFIIWFGVGEAPKIILIAVATTFPLYVNTHGAVRAVDPRLKEAAWIFGVSRVRTVFEIVIPAALPTMLDGLRLSLGIALLALVFAEQINAQFGVGALLVDAQNYFQNNVVMDCVILYAIWGVLGDVVVRGLQWLLVPWLRGVNVH